MTIKMSFGVACSWYMAVPPTSETFYFFSILLFIIIWSLVLKLIFRGRIDRISIGPHIRITIFHPVTFHSTTATWVFICGIFCLDWTIFNCFCVMFGRRWYPMSLYVYFGKTIFDPVSCSATTMAGFLIRTIDYILFNLFVLGRRMVRVFGIIMIWRLGRLLFFAFVVRYGISGNVFLRETRFCPMTFVSKSLKRKHSDILLPFNIWRYL